MPRALVEADWREMGRLRYSRNTHAGAGVSSFTFTPITSVSSKYKQSPHLAVGEFVDDELKTFICAYSHDDFWVLDLMVSSELSHMHACLDYCLDHYERRGVNQFYYAFPNKWAKAYKSFWRENVERLNRYEIEDVCVLPSYKVPTDKWVWEHILHEVVVPVPLLLRRSRLA